MRSVNITRTDSVSDTTGVCRMDLVITSGNDITTKLFVKERLKTAAGANNDVFYTIANTVDIEDYAEDAPATDQSFFRTNSVSLVADSISELNSIFDEVLYLLQLVCKQLDDLDIAQAGVTYTVNGSGSILD